MKYEGSCTFSSMVRIVADIGWSYVFNSILISIIWLTKVIMSLVTPSSLVILEILSTMASLSIFLSFSVFVSVIDDIILVSSRNYKYCVKTNLHLVRSGGGGGGTDGWVTREIRCYELYISLNLSI